MSAFARFIDLVSDSDSDGFPTSPSSKRRGKAPSGAKATGSITTITRTTTNAISAVATSQREPKPNPKPKSKPKAKLKSRTTASSSATAVVQCPAPTPRLSTNPSLLLDKLNAAQRRAVTSVSATVAILAGPGSGKTHTLTSRVAWLIDVVGYRPQDVIVATFTVKAAREMKERIGKVLGEGREKKIVLGTFHSVSRRYLAIYGTRIGVAKNFSIIDDADSKAIITRVIKRLNFEIDPKMARGWISKKKAKGCLGEDQPQQQPPKPEQSKNKLPKKVQQELETTYNEYQAHLDSLNLLDYDDLLVKCAELLRKHPSCVSNVQAVLIDEYQDTNGIQFELMKLFAQARNRVTVVGDPDQSIYGWRSAEATNLFRFLDSYPNTAEIALEENYRSSQCILSTSLQVIQQDQERYQKTLLPIHKKGALPVLRRLENAEREADWITDEITRAIRMSGSMLNHGDVAVLVRSAMLSRPIEQALGSRGIPYRMIGGHKFFERAEIKLLLDYLQVIHQPNNNDALLRIINVPRRGVGPQSLKALIEEAERSNMSLWTLITKHSKGELVAKANLKKPCEKKIDSFLAMMQDFHELPKDVPEIGRTAGNASSSGPLNLVQLVETLIEQLNYKNYISQAYPENEDTRWENVQEFIKLVGEFMRDAKNIEAEDELPAIDGVEQAKEANILAKFLANVTLSAASDKDEEEEGKPKVTISTIHAAKGLEWPVVFIPAAYDGSLPHSRSDDTKEERRLLYVAMTRAKCLLNISYAIFGSVYGSKEQEQTLSPFLQPIASAWFAERGPSYNRALLEELGDILGRKVPSDEEIYRAMPVRLFQEDDKYPIDPMEHTRYQNEEEGNGYEYSSRWRGHGQQQQAKRRKMLDIPSYGGIIGAPERMSCQRGYTTTMEGATSNFTMASFPGFTTASAHQNALLAAASAQEAEAKRSAAVNGKRTAPALAPGQQTIMQSFVRNNSQLAAGSGATPAPQPPRAAVLPTKPYQQPGMFSMQQATPAVSSGIPAEFTSRKIQGVRTNRMTATGNNGVGSGQHASQPKKRYAHFSSSPPPMEMPHPWQPPQQQQSQQHRQQPLQQQQQPYRQIPWPQAYRPPRQQWQPNGKENQVLAGGASTPLANKAAGVKRPGPGATGGGSVAPMDKLRMPFKPPSIKRP